MSTASPLPNDRLAPTASALQRLIATPIKAAAFWTAIVTPLAYPALMVGGIAGNELSLLGLVLAVNVVALVLGRDYKAD